MSSHYLQSVKLPLLSILGSLLFALSAIIIGAYSCRNIFQSRKMFYTTFSNHIFFISLFSLTLLTNFIYGSITTIVDPKGILAFLIGLLVSISTIFLIFSKINLLKSFSIFAALHILAWLTQFFYFLFYGQLFDFVSPFTGTPSSALYVIPGHFSIWRFPGLYDEPALYGMVSFFILTIRLSIKTFKWDVIDYLLALTSCASLSLTSIALTLSAALTTHLKKQRLNFTQFIGLVFVILLIFWNPLDIRFFQYLEARLRNIANDPSVLERVSQGFDTFFLQNEITTLFGVGVGNYSLIPAVGNGFSFIIIYFGIVGLFIFLANLYLLRIRLSVPKENIFFILITLLGAQFFTKPIFWIWLTFSTCYSSFQKQQFLPTSSLK